ncbi:lipopolysaccharide biosynthesis protein [Bacillus pacificus]|uniref:lipopolysaccharide biosynthesis protein n=1 Tax=Bacillus pacificus TaxID=2026187 RepID=UPI0039802A05
MYQKNNLLKKFLEYALGSGIVLIIGFISSPLNTRLFSPTEFGKFSMFLLITNVLNALLLVGLDQSFVRYFHEEEEKDRGKLLYKNLKIPILMCLVSCIVIVIFYKQLAQGIFGVSSNQLLILLILNNFFMILNRFALLAIRMQQKGKLYSSTQVIQKVLNIVLIIMFFMFFHNNFIVLVYAFVISNILVTIVAIYYERRLWSSIKQKSVELNTTNTELLKFGAPLVFTFLVTWLFQSIDRIFIQQYNDYNELGIYSAAFSIIALLNAVQGAFTTFWVPVAYEAYHKDKKNVRFFEKINSLVTYVMFLMGTLIIMLKDIIVVLLGEEFREASGIIPFLVFMPVMYTISETTVLGISFLKKSSYHIVIAVLAAITNIVGNILLVPSLGAKGAAISTGISYIVFFTARTLISRSLYHVNYSIVKFYIMTIGLCLFALYATFKEFDIYYILFFVMNFILLNTMYSNVLIDYFPKKYLKKSK